MTDCLTASFLCVYKSAVIKGEPPDDQSARVCREPRRGSLPRGGAARGPESGLGLEGRMWQEVRRTHQLDTKTGWRWARGCVVTGDSGVWGVTGRMKMPETTGKLEGDEFCVEYDELNIQPAWSLEEEELAFALSGTGGPSLLPVVPSEHETAGGDEPSAGTQRTETSPGATPNPETERRGAPPSSSPQRGAAPPTRALLGVPPAEDVAEAIRGCSKTETTLVRQMATDEPFFLPDSPCRGGRPGGKTGGGPAGRRAVGLRAARGRGRGRGWEQACGPPGDRDGSRAGPCPQRGQLPPLPAGLGSSVLEAWMGIRL